MGNENVIRLEEGIIEVWKHKERRYWQASYESRR